MGWFGKTQLEQDVSEILANQQVIYTRIVLMSAQLEALKAQVAESVAAEKKALQKIQDLLAKLEEGKDDPAAIEAIIAELKASEDPLTEAVKDPAPPAPAPEEETPAETTDAE